MAGPKKNYLVTRDKEDIFFYIEYNSKDLFNVLKNKFDHELILIRKYLSHSDIITKGKLTRSKKQLFQGDDALKCYMLYYQSFEELKGLDYLPIAAQSNIIVPEDFYEETGIPHHWENGHRPREIVKEDGFTVYVPLDTCDDFNLKDLNKICDFNDKFKYDQKDLKHLATFNLRNFLDNDTQLLKADALHIAAHGLGTVKDKLFSYLRSFVFKGDVLNIIIDKNENVLYLFFERNEKYYSLINEIKERPITAPIWRAYSRKDKQKIVETLYSVEIAKSIENDEVQPEEFELAESKIALLLKQYYNEYHKSVDDLIALDQPPKYRWYQKKWREILIKMDEIQFNEKGYARCAISETKGDYSSLGRFFIASHIKPYALCIREKDYESAFDPNNGLILCSNIDALFDQFLITVDDDGIILIKDAVKTITGYGKFKFAGKKLKEYYLTDKRKSYLSLHKAEFDSRT
ncbi:MAG: HNH endonuclease [Clostridia bacterium]|nr:HNH endonuclease [Clostridia bacterium]